MIIRFIADIDEMIRARARGTATNILPKIVLTDQARLRDTIRPASAANPAALPKRAARLDEVC